MHMDPGSGKGIFTWILTGFIGGLVALLIGHFIPSLIPTKAAATRL
jgi:hypothetical protein